MIKLSSVLRADQRGATAIEYGLIVALVGLAASVFMGSMGDSLLSIYEAIVAAFAAAKGG